MPNPYVNKVVAGENTLIDISDTTAVEADVASGKYFYLASGEKVVGSGSGGGTPIKTKTGTVTGGGTTTVAISCDFEPDLIYIHGDMSGSNSNRGVVSITIVKDTVIYMTNDSSTSNANENSAYIDHGISGYGDSTNPHAAYSNGTLTLDTVTNTTAYRFRSGQVYNYKLIKWTA